MSICCLHAVTTSFTFDDQLDLEDLGAVYEALAGISQKWYYIGLSLGVSVSRLDTIKHQYPKFEDALLESLKVWLKQTSKPRTWAALVAALRKKTIQEDDVAATVEHEHGTYVRNAPIKVLPHLPPLLAKGGDLISF